MTIPARNQISLDGLDQLGMAVNYIDCAVMACEALIDTEGNAIATVLCRARKLITEVVQAVRGDDEVDGEGA